MKRYLNNIFKRYNIDKFKIATNMVCKVSIKSHNPNCEYWLNVIKIF